MGVAEHGDLCSFLETHGPLCEAAVQYIARQLLSALQACYARHVFYRDIKLENILLDGCMLSVQIADFGISTNAKHPLKHVCSWKLCMAPELSSGNFYGTPVDIWSLGATIYYFLTGVVPNDELMVLICGTDCVDSKFVWHHQQSFAGCSGSIHSIGIPAAFHNTGFGTRLSDQVAGIA